MRQSTATWVIIAVVVVVLGALAIFGIGRSWWWRGGRHGNGSHHGNANQEHVDDNGHHEDDARDHHMREDEPSGELIDGVRVIEVAVRNFEFDPTRIVVRQGEKVHLKVTSEDVTHGIGIEAYGIDRKLEPGQTHTIEFTADKPGRHHFHCSIYCGSGHGDMHGELVVLARN